MEFKSNSKSGKSNYKFAFILMSSLFFIWGAIVLRN